jgi:hypothetical protein
VKGEFALRLPVASARTRISAAVVLLERGGPLSRIPEV